MQLHGDNVASGIWIYLSCPKQHDACSPGTIAAYADQNRLFWKNHYTVFCPLFFQQDSMSKSMDNVRSDPREQEIMDNYWGNQGYTFFHETYHYGGSVSDPRTGDYCYKAEACWEMAADTSKSTGWAMVNADSYTLEATAIYMQQYFKTPRPAVPRKYTIALDQPTNATNTTTQRPPGPFSDPSKAPPQPTSIFTALNDVPTDLFGDVAGDSISSQDWKPGSKWEVISGPPL